MKFGTGIVHKILSKKEKVSKKSTRCSHTLFSIFLDVSGLRIEDAHIISLRAFQFREKLRKEGNVFVMEVNKITFTRAQ
jgi:hypothetical protein